MWVVVECTDEGEPAEVHGMFPQQWRAEQWARTYLLGRGGWQVFEVSQTLERQD